MLVGIGTSKAWEMAKEGASSACMPPSAMGVEDSGSTSSGSWGVVWTQWQWEFVDSSWQEIGPLTQMNRTGHPARAYTSLLLQTWPLPTPPSGGLQFLGAEPPHTQGWPDVISAGPEKKKKRDLSQRSGLTMKQLKNSQEGQAIKKAGRNTWFSSPWASSSARAGTPPTSIQECTQSISYCSWVEASGSSSLADSSVNETILVV